MAPVTKALLEQGGFKVDMQSMDWQTLVTRRTKKEPADKGGWNIFHTFVGRRRHPESDRGQLLHGRQRRQGVVRLAERSGDGEAARRLRQGDRPGQGQGAGRTRCRTARSRPAQYGWLGQWYGPGATRANVTGWLKAPVPVMWNIEKK